MIKKEIAEIKKQFTPDNSVITRICGCYVNGDKEVKMKTNQAFHSLSEENAFKYYEIFKHSLSGTIGKNLINMKFPLEQEQTGGTQNFLMKLTDSKLEDDELVDELYNKVIENYSYGQNYYIILIHGVYDVPGKLTSGEEMFDASDTVYEYIMCSICHVDLSKAGLGYREEKNIIEERIRDWVVGPTEKAFLFPAFNNRQSDIHETLYYTKKSDDLQATFIKNVLGSKQIPLSAEDQKETFQAIIQDTLGENCNYSMVNDIYSKILEKIDENTDDPKTLVLGKSEIKRLLGECDVDLDKLEQFDKTYSEVVGDKTELVATNLVSTRKFAVETPDVSIKVNADRMDLVETEVRDGRNFIVIAVNNNIEFNGIQVIAE